MTGWLPLAVVLGMISCSGNYPLVVERAPREIAAYVIGPGDMLAVEVWGSEHLTRQVQVLPDGSFFFPLAGTVTAGGRTIAELREDLGARLEPFIAEPEVSVTVVNAGSMMIYVIGRVNSPGRFPVQDNVTILQALAMAGGLSPFADKNDIKVYREQTEATRIFRFRYDDLVEDDEAGANLFLEKGDVVVVP